MKFSLIFRNIRKGIPDCVMFSYFIKHTLRYMCGLSLESSLRPQDVYFLFYGEISQQPLLEWLVC